MELNREPWPIDLGEWPLDILMQMLKWIPYKDIAHLSQANHALLGICRSNRLWEEELKRYYPDKYALQPKDESLPLDAYYQCFKECDEQPFYIESKSGTLIPITKAADLEKWKTCQKLYLLVMEGDFKAIADFRKKNPRTPDSLPETTILEMLFDGSIQNYQHKTLFDWAASAFGQPLLNAAFQEAIGNCSNEQDERLKLLLKQQGYEQIDALFNKELILALILNQPNVVKANIKDNVNQSLTIRGATALFIAAKNGHLELVRYLVKHKANVNQARTDDGLTALFMAAQNGHLQVVKFLVEHGANVNQACTDDGSTALYIAAQEGHLEVVKFLVEHGANVNQARTDNSVTALYIAAQQGHLQVVKFLVEHGATVNQVCTYNGITPLISAAQNGHLQVVKFLVEHGANVNQARTNNGATALYIAVQNGHLQMVKFLVEHGANVNQTLRTDNGVTALYTAAKNGHLQVVKFLVEHGANVNQACTNNGATPLIIAAREGHLQVVNYLRKVAPGVQKITKELIQVLSTKCPPNAEVLDKAIILFDWYAAQPNFPNKEAVNNIVKQLNDLKNNNNDEFTQARFTSIIKRSFNQANANHSGLLFWTKPASYESLKNEDHFKMIEKFILENLDGYFIELNCLNESAGLTNH